MKSRGFTLVEVMIVVAIVGILATVAVPSYRDYVLRSRLVEATSALSDARVRLEQAYADNRSYAGADGACGVQMPVVEHFLVTCEPGGNGQTYALTGTGSGVMTGFVYTLDQANRRATVSWPASWGAIPAEGATRWLLKKGG
jgi:type IV pilus assembly protein PilE